MGIRFSTTPSTARLARPRITAVSPSAVDSKNDRQAYTDSYSFTISRRLPWSSLLEVAYVGNQTRDIAYSNIKNINLVPVGALLSSNNGGVDPASLDANKFRPLLGFNDLYLATNRGWANYNSLQVTWVRTKGRYTDRKSTRLNSSH